MGEMWGHVVGLPSAKLLMHCPVDWGLGQSPQNTKWAALPTWCPQTGLHSTTPAEQKRAMAFSPRLGSLELPRGETPALTLNPHMKPHFSGH